MNGAIAKPEAIWKGRAVLVIKKDKIIQFEKALDKIIEPTLKEKGVISYEAFRVLDDEGKKTNRFEFHELWVSKDAMMIDHKENAPHMKEFFSEIKAESEDGYVESFEVDGKWVLKI